MHVVDHTRESSRPGNAGEQKETRTRTQQQQEFLNAPPKYDLPRQ